ncbi:GTP-binding protein [Pseudolysinimonas sp.]|jgi:G3E family GTPase|uniref:GTP-binding protein n=1 Tax=Pseudolysinimonas sp. TaxID=2680009 RepID=UPI003783F291
MIPTDVIAVVGPCAPERRRYAERLATLTGRAFFPASAMEGAADALEEGRILAGWAGKPGAVLELPTDVSAPEIVGTWADDADEARLVGIVCVIDAAHLLDDLGRDDFVQIGGARGGLPAEFAARAQLTVTQIEYASTVLLVNWAGLSTPELSTTMALVNHLSPHARLRLHRDLVENVEPRPYLSHQDRAGWVCVLNEEFDPYMTDARVSAFRYENLRPFHPERLSRLLTGRVADGVFGTLVRSAGFCRLATRPTITGHWEQVGRTISLAPAAVDGDLSDGDDLLSIGQELAIIGLDLDRERLVAALDQATLTDEELAAGPRAWAGYDDRFPAWISANDRST